VIGSTMTHTGGADRDELSAVKPNPTVGRWVWMDVGWSLISEFSGTNGRPTAVAGDLSGYLGKIEWFFR